MRKEVNELHDGLGTGVSISWAIINSLPAAHRIAYPDRALTKKECQRLFKAGENFATHLAAIMSLPTLLNFQKMLTRNKSIAPGLDERPPFMKFVILKEHKGVYWADISEEGLRFFARMLKKGSIDIHRLYQCPALHAEDRDGTTNVVRSSYHWVQSIAEKYLVETDLDAFISASQKITAEQ